MHIYMFANQSNQQGVPCLWLALGEASPPTKAWHNISSPSGRWDALVPGSIDVIEYVGKLPALRQVDCQGSSPFRHAQLVTLLGCCLNTSFVGQFAEKEWFLTGKSRAQTLVKTLPSAYDAGKHANHDAKLIYGRLACEWWQMS